MAEETETDTRPRLARAVVALSAVSFLTDVRILLRTIPAMLGRTGS